MHLQSNRPVKVFNTLVLNKDLTRLSLNLYTLDIFNQSLQASFF